MATTGRKLMLGSAWRIAYSAATGLVSILIMPFVVHSLGDRMYGIWTVVATFMGYSSVLELGLSQAITRYLGRSLGSQDPEECNRVFNTALRIYLALAGVILALTGVAAALAPVLCRTAEDAALFWKTILLLGINFAMLFPAKVYKGVLEAHLRFDLTAGLDLATLALRTTLVITVVLLGYKVVGLAWATFLTGIPGVAASVYFAHRQLPFLRFDARYWKRETARMLFSYSIYSFICHIADLLRSRVDNIVVAAYVGLAAVTHYSIAGRLAQYYMDIVSALLGVFPSVFSRQEGAKDHAAMQRTFFLASKLSLCIAGFIAFGLIAWGKVFIARWMGPRYADAYPVLVALTLAFFVLAAQAPSPSLLFGISKHKFLSFMDATESALNLALSILLARRYGMLGVAVGTLIPMLLSRILVQPVYVCRVSGFGYFNYVRAMGRTFGAILLSLILPALIAVKFASPSYPILICIALVSGILYVVPLWLFEFNASETQVLRRALWPAGGRKGAQAAIHS
jgi:O-antigen/teichoic acid export membrane protein